MRHATKPETYLCSFPDFDGDGFTVDATSDKEAAERAASQWERDIEHWSTRDGLEVLSVLVTLVGGGTARRWEVLGVEGRYVGKRMPS